MKLTSWCIKLISLLSILLILKASDDIGVMGCVLISIGDMVWAVCSYIDARREERS